MGVVVRVGVLSNGHVAAFQEFLGVEEFVSRVIRSYRMLSLCSCGRDSVLHLMGQSA